jgi:fatty acid desaturase
MKPELEKQLLRRLARVSAARGLWSLVWSYSLILGALALYVLRPNALTFAVAFVIVGTRQHALAILMHEAAHFLLLPNRNWNDRVSDWLCAAPLMLSTAAYRQIHFAHHKHTWTEQDPDLLLASRFPVTKRSLLRKVSRDLLGIVGLKRQIGLARAFGGLSLTGKGLEGKRLATVGATLLKNQYRFLVFNGVVCVALTALGRPEAYVLLWLLPSLTLFSLMLRLRSIAEHAAIDDPNDELKHTRTTLAPAWVRFFVAPHNVGYHLEHHLYQFVPQYHLPTLHRALFASGALDGAEVSHGYRSVWRKATSAQQDTP